MTDGKRRCAAFTIVRDEPVFLALWHRHYSRVFETCDLYVLHHVATEDESAEGAFAAALGLFDAANITRLVNPEFDPSWLGSVVSDALKTLLARHDAVLFAEADELLVAASGLRAFIDGFLADDADARAVRCTGFELHHDFGAGEPPLDTTVPILAQRRRWHRNTLYDKALLTRMPLTWAHGFHTCEEVTSPPLASLVLVHLHKYDFQAYIARHEARARYRHSPDAVANGLNAHYRKMGPQLIAQFMALPAPLEDVPAWVSEALEGI